MRRPDESQPSRSEPWATLAGDYERARSKEDSFDRLVEWPAQRRAIGDVSGLTILDVGCGNGSKLAQLVAEGARGVGVDHSGNFLEEKPPECTLVRGDLNELGSLEAVCSQRFDRILFLQSFGYATDPVATLRLARSLLTEDGYIVLTRTHPVRYAVERAEEKGTSLGEEYFSEVEHDHRHSWNPAISLTKRPYTVASLLNTFGAAGLWIEQVEEPQLSAEDTARYPHKKAWMDKHLGIFVFVLRPLP